MNRESDMNKAARIRDYFPLGIASDIAFCKRLFFQAAIDDYSKICSKMNLGRYTNFAGK